MSAVLIAFGYFGRKINWKDEAEDEG